MKENGELRKEARAAIRGKWFWRILLVTSSLYGISFGVNALLSAAYAKRGIMQWHQLVEKKLQALQQGLQCSLPNADATSSFTSGLVFEIFITMIFGAIVAFGLARITLRAYEAKDEGWFAASFGGFRRPLEIAWLLFFYNLTVAFWSCIFSVPAALLVNMLTGSNLLAGLVALPLIFPGVMAFYSYRQTWYVKSEKPDLSAGECLRESARIMKGWRMRAFSFDLFYVFLLMAGSFAAGLVLTVLRIAAGADSLIGGLVAAAASFALCGYVLWVIIYYLAGRAAFYRAQKEALAKAPQAGVPEAQGE